MTITLIIFGSLLAFAAIGSAISKLVKVPDVMAVSYTHLTLPTTSRV